MMRRPILSARSRASVFTRTASVTCSGDRGRALQRAAQAVVADKGDAVEIDLGLKLRRQHRARRDLAERDGAEQARREARRPPPSRPRRRGFAWSRAGADVTGERLRRRRHQHVEQQRHQRALADAEQDEAEQDRNLAPVVAHDEGEPDQRDACTARSRSGRSGAASSLS